ncbi:MAG TPA: hypothetical protein VF516_46560 [Kofleriaceae bacterium]
MKLWCGRRGFDARLRGSSSVGLVIAFAFAVGLERPQRDDRTT